VVVVLAPWEIVLGFGFCKFFALTFFAPLRQWRLDDLLPRLH
jgi:hypothetical protein